MRNSISIVGLILAFACGFMAGEYQHAKFQERLKREQIYVRLASRKETSDSLEKALDEMIRRMETPEPTR